MNRDAPDSPHRRYNALTGEWILVSAGRTARPWLGEHQAAELEALPRYDPTCYLCPGNQRAGGVRNPDYDGTFVFTNDFAALRPEDGQERHDDGLLRSESEAGTCRVVCFSPRHDRSLGRLGAADIRRVIDTWADQTAELGRRYRWVQVFENRGAAMGASNPHPHGQIWAGTALPVEATKEAATQQRYLQATRRRLLVDYAERESRGQRVVDEDHEWLTIVPFWAAWPYETLLVPRRPWARLPDLDDGARDTLVTSLQRILARYDNLFGSPMPYSMGWHGAPFDEDSSIFDPWQLHAHVYPPLLRATARKFMVGYELLAEPQRDLSPEAAADQLRSASPTAGQDTG